MNAETTYERTVRDGFRLAALAGFVSSSAAVLIILQEAVGDAKLPLLTVAAVASATIVMPLFWRQLAPTGTGFSIGLSALAGAMTVLFCHVAMWLVTAVVIASETREAGSNFVDFLLGVSSAFLASAALAVFSVVLAGWITLPLGILAAIAVTLWARRRLASLS